MAGPPLWATLLAPIATLIVGGIASGVAILAIRANREIARNRATFDYLERTESTIFYQEISRTFISLKRSPDGFKTIFDPQTEEHIKQRQHVMQYLNHYENVSLGIQWGTLSEEIYYRAYRSALLADWEAAKPVIENRRTSTLPSRPPNPRAFVEFDWLARRWEPTAPMPGEIEVRRNRLSTRHLFRIRR